MREKIFLEKKYNEIRGVVLLLDYYRFITCRRRIVKKEEERKKRMEKRLKNHNVLSVVYNYFHLRLRRCLKFTWNPFSPFLSKTF